MSAETRAPKTRSCAQPMSTSYRTADFKYVTIVGRDKVLRRARMSTCRRLG
jgi:hypothetical protein